MSSPHAPHLPRLPNTRLVHVATNSYRVTWNTPKEAVYHYDMFQPLGHTRKDKKDINIGKEKRMELIQRLQRTIAAGSFPHIGAFDGKCNLYTWIKPFVGGSFDYNVPWFHDAVAPEDRKALLRFTLVRTIHSQILANYRYAKHKTQEMAEEVADSLNMLNIFVQAKPREDNRLSKASSFYVSDGSASMKKLPLKIYLGVFQAVKINIRGELLLNVDVTMAAVMPQCALTGVLLDILGTDSRMLQNPSQDQVRKLEAFIRGLKADIFVPKQRPGKAKTIKGIVLRVGRQTFEKKDKDTGEIRVITVQQHFWDTHKQEIDDREIGVRCGGGELIPLRFVHLKEQLYKSRLPPEATQDMLTFAPKLPQMRLEKIGKQWRHLGYSQSEYLANAGVNVDPTPIQIQGLQLQQPDLLFGAVQNPSQTFVLKPKQRGKWDVKDQQFVTAARVDKFLVVDFTGNPSARRNVHTFTQDLQKEMVRKRMMAPETPQADVVAQRPEKDLVKQLYGMGCKAKPRLVVVILPENAAGLYLGVKHFGDVAHGVATQCVRWNGRPKDNQYMNNLLLKINMKLGGVNFVPSNDTIMYLKNEPVLILGADVSHPAPGSMSPSIASVVASYDGASYWATTAIQHSRVEIIENLAEMVRKLLGYHVRKTSRAPAQIIYFRDGVSEGEFPTVLQREKQAILEGLKMAYADEGKIAHEFEELKAKVLAREAWLYQHRNEFTPEALQAEREIIEEKRRKANVPRSGWTREPKMLFIVVGKRHHHRFFPIQNKGTPTDNSQNVEAGLVVPRDSALGNAFYNDFYLQSQKGLKGTSIPAHYTILYDDIFQNDLLIQNLCYTLCNSYGRATTSVKIPAPVYYADLVCRRAKNHFDPTSTSFSDNGDSASSTSMAEQYEAIFQQCLHDFKAVNKDLAGRMYFV